MARFIAFNGGHRDIEDDITLARLTQHESRLAHAFMCLLQSYEELEKRPQRFAIDDDFVGWQAWNGGRDAPRDKQLLLRFKDGGFTSSRTYGPLVKWGDKANDIVAYRVVEPS